MFQSLSPKPTNWQTKPLKSPLLNYDIASFPQCQLGNINMGKLQSEPIPKSKLFLTPRVLSSLALRKKILLWPGSNSPPAAHIPRTNSPQGDVSDQKLWASPPPQLRLKAQYCLIPAMAVAWSHVPAAKWYSAEGLSHGIWWLPTSTAHCWQSSSL